jgi:hypothetical protein
VRFTLRIRVAKIARPGSLVAMPAVEGLRSPYDKTAGGLHHRGRMIDKIRLRQAGRLPPIDE